MAYLLVLAALAAAGCTTSPGKFTRPNYESLFYSQPSPEAKKAMGEPSHITRNRWEDLSPEVRKTLGKPLEGEFDCWEYIRKKPPSYRAMIFLQDERVVGRVWYEGSSTQPSPLPSPRKGLPGNSETKHKRQNQTSDQPTSAPGN
jgi:hypothetical protein